MKKRVTAALLAALICLTCTACTTAFSNAGAYFDNVGTVLHNLFPGGTDDGPEPDGNAVPLAAPTDFTIDEAGSYSFTGVEGADYYLLYYCAPGSAETDTDFLYTSEPIRAQADGACTGLCRDVIRAPYGEYQVRAVAFPASGDTSHRMSAAATADYTAVGPQSMPRMEYFWDPFVGTLSLQLANANDYAYEAYPERVEIAIANADDPADSVSLMLEGIAQGNTEISTDGLTPGARYRITAAAVSASPYVTNLTTDETAVADALSLGELNILTPGYAYSTGMMNYPLLWETFDLANGGEVGDLVSFGGPYTFNCVPAEPGAGCAYSYTFTARPFVVATGTLELMEDGTAVFTNRNSPPLPDSSISGVWSDNGDGTATLCFSVTTWGPI